MNMVILGTIYESGLDENFFIVSGLSKRTWTPFLERKVVVQKSVGQKTPGMIKALRNTDTQQVIRKYLYLI